MITESIGAETGRNRYLEQIAAVGADGIDEAVFCRLGFLDRHDDRSLDSRRFEENIFVLIDLHAPVGSPPVPRISTPSERRFFQEAFSGAVFFRNSAY